MTEIGAKLLVREMFDLFSMVKTLPEERTDWIAWVYDLHAQLDFIVTKLRGLLMEGDLAVSEKRERYPLSHESLIELRKSAAKVIELLYGEDLRSTCPWGWRDMPATPPAPASGTIMYGQLQIMNKLLDGVQHELARFGGAADKFRELAELGKEWLASPTLTEAFKQGMAQAMGQAFNRGEQLVSEEHERVRVGYEAAGFVATPEHFAVFLEDGTKIEKVVILNETDHRLNCTFELTKTDYGLPALGFRVRS